MLTHASHQWPGHGHVLGSVFAWPPPFPPTTWIHKTSASPCLPLPRPGLVPSVAFHESLPRGPFKIHLASFSETCEPAAVLALSQVWAMA